MSDDLDQLLRHHEQVMHEPAVTDFVHLVRARFPDSPASMTRVCCSSSRRRSSEARRSSGRTSAGLLHTSRHQHE
jgi:hypothetical protein